MIDRVDFSISDERAVIMRNGSILYNIPKSLYTNEDKWKKAVFKAIESISREMIGLDTKDHKSAEKSPKKSK